MLQLDLQITPQGETLLFVCHFEWSVTLNAVVRLDTNQFT
jgi:hypothetical protein